MVLKKPGPPQAEAPQKSPSADLIKKTISYLYLLSFCDPKKLPEFTRLLSPYRQALLKTAGLDEPDFNQQILPQACHHIVAYSQATRYPDEKVILELLTVALNAARSREDVLAFQNKLTEISFHPGRSKMEHRLHRNKGCRLCNNACSFGYFSLVSDPRMNLLQNMLQEESVKPREERSPLVVLYTFTLLHLAGLTGMRKLPIRPDALANLSYCLLLLGMAKSRLPVPEQQLRLIQAGNQEYIRRNQIH